MAKKLTWIEAHNRLARKKEIFSAWLTKQGSAQQKQQYLEDIRINNPSLYVQITGQDPKVSVMDTSGSEPTPQPKIPSPDAIRGMAQESGQMLNQPTAKSGFAPLAEPVTGKQISGSGGGKFWQSDEFKNWVGQVGQPPATSAGNPWFPGQQGVTPLVAGIDSIPTTPTPGRSPVGGTEPPQQPLYATTLEKQPFYFDFGKITDENINQLPWIDQQRAKQRAWFSQLLTGKKDYNFLTNPDIKSDLDWFSYGAKIMERALTSQPDQNIVGNLALTGFNVLVQGGAFIENVLQAAPDLIQRQNLLVQANQAESKGDIQTAGQLREQANQIYLARQDISMKRMQEATGAINRSWEQLGKSLEQLKPENLKSQESYPISGVPADATPSERSAYIQQAQNKYYREQAVNLSDQAQAMYQAGDVQTALSTMEEAIDNRIKAEPLNTYGAYTWIREPDRYAAFRKDAAFLELQKGSPLTSAEIDRLKEYHANSWTEFAGQGLFDPMWLVPQKVWDLAFEPVKFGVGALWKGVKAVPIVGDAVQFLARTTAGSQAQKVGNTVFDFFKKFSTSYAETDKAIGDMDRVSALILNIQRNATGPDEALSMFKDAKATIPGLEQFTFKDFKRIADLADLTTNPAVARALDPTTWAAQMRSSVESTAPAIEKLAAEDAARQLGEGASPEALKKLTGELTNQYLSDTRYITEPMMDFSGKFTSAFVDPRRIYEGSKLLDDSLAGNAVRLLRELAGKDVNPKAVRELQLGGADFIKNYLAEKGIGRLDLETTDNIARAFADAFGPSSWIKKTFGIGANIIENASTWGMHIRDAWVTAVLSLNPSWVVRNYVDSSFRHIVYGGNLFDDIRSLAFSLQHEMEDATGQQLMEFTQSLARINLGYKDRVATRYQMGWKPKSPFSFFGYEFQRLGQERSEKAILDGATNAGERNVLSWIIDAGRSIPGGISDMNSAIEYTLRLRMFHDEYFKALSVLEPKVVDRIMGEASPELQGVMRQLWAESGSNPGKLSALVDDFIGNATKGSSNWSLLVPPNLKDALPLMDLQDQKLLINPIKEQLRQLITTIRQNGREPVKEDFEKFFSEIMSDGRDEIQAHLSQVYDQRGISGTLNTENVASVVPAEMSSPAPKPNKTQFTPRESVRAAQKLESKKFPLNIQKPANLVKNYEAAVAPYAEMKRVAGAGLTVANKDGHAIVSVGDEWLNKKSSELYTALKDATIKAFGINDSDILLKNKINNVADYVTLVNDFIKDPTALRNSNESAFLMIADQLHQNPHYEDLLKRLGTKFDYESALDNYRMFGALESYSVSGMPAQIERFMTAADKLAPVPADYRMASIEHSLTTRKLGSLYMDTTLSLEDREKIGELIARTANMREQYHQFGVFFYPGPRTMSGESRQGAWNLSYKLWAENHRGSANLNNEVVDAFVQSPEIGRAKLAEVFTNFEDNFLARSGINVSWDADRQFITEVRINRNGRWIIATDDYTKDAVYNMFYSDYAHRVMDTNKPIRISTEGLIPVRDQMVRAFRNTFNTNQQEAESIVHIIERHAQELSYQTGLPVEKYYERLGFKKVGTGLELDGEKGILDFQKAAAQANKNGDFRFYGLANADFPSLVRSTSGLFFNDLRWASENGSEIATEDFATLKAFIEEQTGQTLRRKLTDEQNNLIADTWMRYLNEGTAPDIKLVKPFENLKKWMSPIGESVQGTTLEEELPADVRLAFDRLFTDITSNPPSANTRLNKIIADEVGMGGKNEEELLQAINQGRAKPYRNLGEVPTGEATATFSGGRQTETKMTAEMKRAWNVLKKDSQFAGFSKEALASPDALRAHILERMADNWPETSAAYRNILWRLEQSEEKIADHIVGQSYKELLYPPIPMGKLDSGVKTWIAHRDYLLGNYEQFFNAMNSWKQFMFDSVDNKGTNLARFTKEQIAELVDWKKEAVGAKAQLVSTILNGGTMEGQNIEGTVNKVNKVMIDYQHTTIFDQLMQNFFPFWKFPSRSWPFWAEALSTHPEVIATYNKLQELSQSQLYQANATTTSGYTKPSYRGYINIPGTDMWYNPLSPFSFQYMLDRASGKQTYSSPTDPDIGPMANITKQFMETSPVYGFSMSPWMIFLAKKAFNLSDEIAPPQPIVPQLNMIPRFMIPDMIRIGRMIAFPTYKDLWYPEVRGQDYVVENRVLSDNLQKIRDPNLPGEQKIALMNQIEEAISKKGDNKLWVETYNNIQNEGSERSALSLFTGMYVKPFTENDADLLRLRDENSLLRSSMNNEMQAAVFDIPTDPHDAWAYYQQQQSTPESWMNRLRSDLGWVTDEKGALVTDPKERAQYLAQKIDQENTARAHYSALEELTKQYNARLKALPIGAPFEQKSVVYSWYSDERKKIDDQYPLVYERKFGTYKPEELIQEEIRSKWFNLLRATRPTWDFNNNEKYQDYLSRVSEWENDLPVIAPELMNKFFIDSKDINDITNSLHKDQKVGDIFTQLLKESSADGIHAWDMQNDTVFDALNKAWNETYFKPYWNAMLDPNGEWKTGAEFDLAQYDFEAQHQFGPPTADEFYTWIQANYGDRFTYDEVAKWVNYSGVMSMQEEQTAAKGKTYQLQQDIWNVLSWGGPSHGRDLLREAAAYAGIDKGSIDAWYKSKGTVFNNDPEKLQAFHDGLMQAAKDAKLEPPTRAQLIEYVNAQHLNDDFDVLVDNKFGPGFQDQVLNVYDSLPKPAQGKYKREFPQNYAMIKQYFHMRDWYGDKNPLWAKYYLGRNVTVTYNTPTGIVSTGAVKPSGYKPPTPQRPNLPTQEVTFPSGFISTVGTGLSREIINTVNGNGYISPAAEKFLRGLAIRHPEWATFINRVLR